MRATRRLAHFLRPYWRSALLAPLLMVIEVAMDLTQPWLIARIVDVGIARSDLNFVVNTGLLMVAFALIGLVGGAGCTIFTMLAAQGFGADLRGSLFRKIQSLSFGNLDRLETGKLITRLTNDVTQVQEVVAIVLRVMIRVPLLLIGSVIMAVLTSPKLALLFLVLIPLIAAALALIVRKTYPMFSEVQRRLDSLNTVMQENLAGVRVVKAFARASHELARFRQTNDRLMTQNIAVVRTSAVTMPLMMLAVNAGVVAVIWLGGISVTVGELKVGALIAFINYLMQALNSLMAVSMLVMRVSRAEASAMRIAEVYDDVPDVRNPAAPDAGFVPRGRVAFENVGFSHLGDDHDATLKNINVVAEPGQTVALLGATGSGKSSLIDLIPRFYDVSSGRVTLDGVDVREIAETTLRKTIAVALQETVLFTGTLRDNIRYGRPTASEAEVVAAAAMAQAHDFISRFPDGYDSIVGQRGVNLSGGQKQRVAIARALLTQPVVLILDDSTSAVDVETEGRIQAALADLPWQQTRFVVAQRISTVLNADKILVLDDGAIVGEGTHAELLRENSVYREIYESQMANGAISHGAE